MSYRRMLLFSQTLFHEASEISVVFLQYLIQPTFGIEQSSPNGSIKDCLFVPERLQGTSGYMQLPAHVITFQIVFICNRRSYPRRCIFYCFSCFLDPSGQFFELVRILCDNFCHLISFYGLVLSLLPEFAGYPSPYRKTFLRYLNEGSIPYPGNFAGIFLRCSVRCILPAHPGKRGRISFRICLGSITVLPCRTL